MHARPGQKQNSSEKLFAWKWGCIRVTNLSPYSREMLLAARNEWITLTPGEPASECSFRPICIPEWKMGNRSKWLIDARWGNSPMQSIFLPGKTSWSVNSFHWFAEIHSVIKFQIIRKGKRILGVIQFKRLIQKKFPGGNYQRAGQNKMFPRSSLFDALKPQKKRAAATLWLFIHYFELEPSAKTFNETVWRARASSPPNTSRFRHYACFIFPLSLSLSPVRGTNYNCALAAQISEACVWVTPFSCDQPFSGH